MSTPAPIASTTGPGFPENGSIHTRHMGTDVAAKLITQQPQFADISAAPTQANFNALLATLRSAGIIAP